MEHPKNLFLSLFIFVILSNGCTQTSQKLKQESSPEQSSLMNEKSYISLPLELELKDIENIINHQLGRKIVVDKTTEQNIIINVERAGRIRISNADNKLATSVPIRVKVTKGNFLKKLKADFVLSIDIENDFSIDPYWNVVTESKVVSFWWIEEPKLSLFGVNINIKNIIENVLNDKKDELTSSLDQSIRKKVNLRKQIERVWTKLQKPRNIAKKAGESFYLKIKPQQVSFISHQFKNNSLIINLLFESYFSLSSTFPKHEQKVPLPSLHTSKQQTSGFDITLIAEVNFDSLNHTIDKVLSTQPSLEIEGYEVSLDLANITPSGQNLLIDLRISGTINGLIRGAAKISVDTAKHRVQLDLINLEIEEGDIELELAHMVFGDFVNDYIREYGGFNYQSALEEIPKYIQQGIAKGKSGDKWHPVIHEMKTRIVGIELTQEAIVLKAKGEGRASVVIDKLK